MRDYLLFEINGDDLNNQINDLNLFLNMVGSKAEMVTNGDQKYLTIHINQEALSKKLKRGAGRRTGTIKKLNREKNPTIAEYKKMRESMTHAQIIEELGCSKATYFRTLKYNEPFLNDDDFQNSKFF